MPISDSSSHIDLRSHQEEIRKQVESNTVVLYNLKDNNAFYAITPEEARFAIDAIKKRRSCTHYSQIVPLKDQDHYRKHKETYDKRDGVILFMQNISNLQLATKDYYAQTSVSQRGVVAEEGSVGEIFDIAVNPSNFDKTQFPNCIKRGFLSLLREKVANDLVTYECMLNKLLSDGKITKEEMDLSTIKYWEVAVKLLYGGTRGHLTGNDWVTMAEEEKKKLLTRLMKEDEEEYKEIEDRVKNMLGSTYKSFYQERKAKETIQQK